MDYIASSTAVWHAKQQQRVDDSVDKRVALEEGFSVIATHEAALAQQFVSGLDGKNHFADVLVAAVTSAQPIADFYKFHLRSACAWSRVPLFSAIAGVMLHGLDADDLGGPQVHGDAPHSRYLSGCPPEHLSRILSSQGLMATYGDFYAVEVANTLGLAESGGMLRVGFMHYSTEEEVDTTLAAIDAAVPV